MEKTDPQFFMEIHVLHDIEQKMHSNLSVRLSVCLSLCPNFIWYVTFYIFSVVNPSCDFSITSLLTLF